MLKSIGNALVASDVSLPLVIKLRKNIKMTVNLNEMAAGMNQRKIIHKAVFDELCNLLDPAKEPYKPKKGKTNVIMFVGLQGAGKTTTVSKMAHFYKRKGFNPCLVCADTYRAGAFDQLRQNATKIKIPFYGSHVEADAVKISSEGVEMFKKEGKDLIIVDTSGRHKQEAGLFLEMQQIADAVKPDNIVFVMDGSIGQAAFDQAQAFKNQVKVGSVIITKLDGHAKGGGALSAVAATESPIIFLGTGEHMEDLDSFDAKSFVSKLLGMGDVTSLMKTFQDVLPADKAPELAARIADGKFTLRDMYEQLGNVMKMGPLNKIMEMMPGMSGLSEMMKGHDGSAKLKSMLNIMDSMTPDELDSDKPLKEPSRVIRVAKGSGRTVREVQELLEQHKQFAKMIHKIKPLSNAKMTGRNQQANLAKMANAVPASLINKMGGVGGLTNMLKQMQDIPGFNNFK